MDRPARVQVQKADLDNATADRVTDQQQQQQASAVFNTWYGKWAGGDKTNTKFRNPYRCDPARDSGYTKSQGPFFCLWFARGCCFRGADCDALHRVPQKNDVTPINNARDCFGRVKHSDYREDMAGVGSLLKENRTLFVGYFGKDRGSGAQLVQELRKQFEEWGHVDRIKLGKNNSISFITYEAEINAQFAKEAMSNQSIFGKETITVRWSRDSFDNGRGRNSDTVVEEENIRRIVRQVIALRRDAELTESRKSAKRTTGDDITGIISAEAARKIDDLKRRRLELNRSPTEESAKLPKPSKEFETDHAEPTPKRGLVDYD